MAPWELCVVAYVLQLDSAMVSLRALGPPCSLVLESFFGCVMQSVETQYILRVVGFV